MQKKLLTLLLMAIMSLSLVAQDTKTAKNPIIVRNESNKGINRHPQAPALIPVVCSHDEYSVFVESRYSLFADITVEDEYGTTVTSTAALLTPDLPLTISINQPGAFKITIQIEESVYSGSFTL